MKHLKQYDQHFVFAQNIFREVIANASNYYYRCKVLENASVYSWSRIISFMSQLLYTPDGGKWYIICIK